jgi:Uma2 family endonuclease
MRYTYAEYLGFETSSNVKHEFLDGQIYAMAGGTPEHAALAAAVITLLGPQLRGGECRPYNSDLRVRTPTGLTTYPDVTVICGPRTIDALDPLAVTNPALIVEVLSRSTEEYDSGDKFEHYKTFPSLREYVLVSHRERSVKSDRAEKAAGERASFTKVRSQNFRSTGIDQCSASVEKRPPSVSEFQVKGVSVSNDDLGADRLPH